MKSAEVIIRVVHFMWAFWVLSAGLPVVDLIWFTGEWSLFIGRLFTLALFASMACTVAVIMEQHAEKVVVRWYEKRIESLQANELPSSNGHGVAKFERARN